MKFSTSKIIVISFLFLFTLGCKKNYIISEKQQILFQLDYINYAWGYHHIGFFIDKEGNVLTYKNPETWNYPDKDNSISQTQITENISKCFHSGKIIPQEELQKYTNYIRNIASSKITAMKNVAADAGSSEYFCYLYSDSNETYKGYLIKMEGDFTCENLNFYAKGISMDETNQQQLAR